VAEEKPPEIPEAPKEAPAEPPRDKVEQFLDRLHIGTPSEPKYSLVEFFHQKQTYQKILGAIFILGQTKGSSWSPAVIARISDVSLGATRYILPKIDEIGLINYRSGGSGYKAKVTQINVSKIKEIIDAIEDIENKEKAIRK
jgi:hypothetical protein